MANWFYSTWQVVLVVNTLGCSADDQGSILGGGAEKGNLDFLAAQVPVLQMAL